MDEGRAVQNKAAMAYPDAMNISHANDLRFTADEFDRLAQAGVLDERTELREGTIVKMNPSYVPHGRVHGELFFLLSQVVRAELPNLRAMLEVTLDLGQFFQPLPDIVVWDTAALQTMPERTLPGRAVCLVVEVSDSTLPDDLGAKLASYARAGLREYWVADVAKQRLLLHAEPDGETYARRVPHAFGERVQALTLPLVIDTSSLLKS